MYSYLELSYLGVSLVLLCIISVHYGASFLAVDELTEQTDGSSGCGEVEGWVFICWELQFDKVNNTCGGR